MSEPTAIPASGNAEVDPNATRDSFLRRWRWWLIIGGPAVILAIVAYVVLTGGRFESTDNAYVQIAKVPVAANVGGRVTDVYVRENQVVRRGQLLFRLDARDYQANAQAAAAAVANSTLQINALRAGYRQQLAAVEAARQTVAYTATEATRQRNLLAAGVARSSRSTRRCTPPSRRDRTSPSPSNRPPRRSPSSTAIPTWRRAPRLR